MKWSGISQNMLQKRKHKIMRILTNLQLHQYQVSTQVQTDQSCTQGTAKKVVAERRQQYTSVGENKAHLVGYKHLKQNVSWRQRNSSDVSESHKG